MQNETSAEVFCAEVRNRSREQGADYQLAHEATRVLHELGGRRVNMAGMAAHYAFKDGSVASLNGEPFPVPVPVPSFLKCSGLAGDCELAAGHHGHCADCNGMYAKGLGRRSLPYGF